MTHGTYAQVLTCTHAHMLTCTYAHMHTCNLSLFPVLTRSRQHPHPHLHIHTLILQSFGITISTNRLQQEFQLTKVDKASKACELMEATLNQYSNHLDSQHQDGQSKLLAAYGKLAAKEESLILAEQVHTKSYKDNSLSRGRLQFLTYLHERKSEYVPCGYVTSLV